MAAFLSRLGRFSHRRRGLVVLLWVLVLGLGGVGAVTLSGPTSNTFSIPGTQSQQALNLLQERLPQARAGNATARVVFVAKSGKVTDPTTMAAIERTVAKLGQLPEVAQVADPFKDKAISPNLSTALATVTYKVQATNITSADRQALLTAVADARTPTLSVNVGGDAAQQQVPQSHSEVIGLVVAGLVLVLTFGSLLAAGLPLVTAIAGVSLGMLGITIASGFTQISSTTPTLALMLGLAVAIDYSLFIVSRFRHELLAGRTPEEAAGRAVGTAGSAVVFAGATVVIALAALSVAGIPFLTTMGLAAAATVAGAVVIALTLLPALLGFLGVRVLGRKGMAAHDAEGEDATDAAARSSRMPVGERWARLVGRHRVVAALAVLIGLGVVAVPAHALQLGMPSDATAPLGSTQRAAYDELAAGFGPGFNGPLLVVADLTGVGNPSAAADRVHADLSKLKGVAYTSPVTLGPSGTIAIFSAIPTTGPDSAATADLVRTIRADAPGWQAQTGAQVLVTGQTAVQIDVSSKLGSALLPYLAVVVGLAFVLLALVFRSLLVPLKATLGFLLSVGAAFGVVVAVFQWGWLSSVFGVQSTAPIMSFLPILLVGILFGLAMDYQVFLVTRMREEHLHGASANESIALGFRHGARVVTAAGIIMASVFGGFVTGQDPVIKSIGLGLAFGVLADAFLVRMTLVPAVMSLLGDRAWWLPRWLDRVLPNVDVEGQKLADESPELEPVPTR